MASFICISLSPLSRTLALLPSTSSSSSSSTSTSRGGRFSLVYTLSNSRQRTRRMKHHVVCMAPEEEKLTRRNPLDFPSSGRGLNLAVDGRPDIFPKFSPMKTPLPPPIPYDPPEEDEEEEEKEEEQEEEEDPEKEEDPENPEK